MSSKVSTVGEWFFHIHIRDHQVDTQSHTHPTNTDHTYSFVDYTLVTIDALVFIFRT